MARHAHVDAGDAPVGGALQARPGGQVPLHPVAPESSHGRNGNVVVTADGTPHAARHESRSPAHVCPPAFTAAAHARRHVSGSDAVSHPVTHVCASVTTPWSHAATARPHPLKQLPG